MGSRVDHTPDHCSVSKPITNMLPAADSRDPTADYMPSSARGAWQAHGMILGHFVQSVMCTLRVWYVDELVLQLVS
jgi:hypothetical protein